jgi:hypothetical protein
MSDYRGEENIIAVHLADAEAPVPHMVHVCRPSAMDRTTVLLKMIKQVCRAGHNPSDMGLHQQLPNALAVSYFKAPVGYVVDVSYRDLPEEPNAWFVKFTAYRTTPLHFVLADAYTGDSSRCRGGVLIRVTGEKITAYGATGIFCGVANDLHDKHGVDVYGKYSPPAPAVVYPKVVWVYFHTNTGKVAYVSEHRGPVASGYEVRRADVSKR